MKLQNGSRAGFKLSTESHNFDLPSSRTVDFVSQSKFLGTFVFNLQAMASARHPVALRRGTVGSAGRRAENQAR